MHKHLVSLLGLPINPTHPLHVMVGNGSEIECHECCEEVTLQIQGQPFTMDLHVLPLSGADIMLKVQWLKSLGSVLTDYNDLTMKFLHEGQMIKLHGDSNAFLHLLTVSQLRRLVRMEVANEFFHIQVLPREFPDIHPSSPLTHHHSSIINTLTRTFATLFHDQTTFLPNQLRYSPSHKQRTHQCPCISLSSLPKTRN